MFEILINPSNFQDTYIECLNECFNNWGNIDNYNWAFIRACGSQPADIIIIKKNGEVVAGSAITYRTANINNESIKVGIMTASWTLPAARGQGCFTKIIEESLKLSKKNNTELLLAFVTETNASYRRLKNQGALLFPLYYMESLCKEKIQNCDEELIHLSKKDIAIKEVYNCFVEKQKGFAHIDYSYEQWYSQFISRPSNIIVLKISNKGYAIVEEFTDIYRILCLTVQDTKDFKCVIGSLINRSHLLGKKLQYFTTEASLKSICDTLGFNTISAFLTMQFTNKEFNQSFMDSLLINKDDENSKNNDLRVMSWHLQSGDRM